MRGVIVISHLSKPSVLHLKVMTCLLLSKSHNLLKLANFVVSKTLLNGCDAQKATLDTLENMNLQIAEGLLEAA